MSDGSTASGGEVFAAAVRDNKRGKLVGVTTYGKSIVQRFIPLPSGGGVHMTVAHFTTPDLKPIKDRGIKPDVTVDLASIALRDDSENPKPKEDVILQKALSILKSGEAQKKAA